MPPVLSQIAVKDGNAALVAGGVDALDMSGAGVGPWSFTQVILDGTSGTNRATVNASGAISVTAVLTTGTAPLGTVTLATGTATVGGVFIVTGSSPIGSLTTGTAPIGTVSLTTGSAPIGSLTTGAATVGGVFIVTGSAPIGTVALTTGSAIVGALVANQSVNVAQINGVTPLMGSGNTGTGSPRVTIATDQAALAAAGQGATGAAVPSGAVYMAGDAATALPSAAIAGNLTGAMFDKFGRQVVLQQTVRDLIGTQATTISASTTETNIVTAAASTFNDLMMLIVSNTSSATNTRIDIRDTTGGSVLFSLQSNGGQPPIGFSLGGVAIPQTTVNTSWTAQCTGSVTDIRIYAVFAKNR